jgi:hypothetical protein
MAKAILMHFKMDAPNPNNYTVFYLFLKLINIKRLKFIK